MPELLRPRVYKYEKGGKTLYAAEKLVGGINEAWFRQVYDIETPPENGNWDELLYKDDIHSSYEEDSSRPASWFHLYLDAAQEAANELANKANTERFGEFWPVEHTSLYGKSDCDTVGITRLEDWLWAAPYRADLPSWEEFFEVWDNSPDKAKWDCNIAWVEEYYRDWLNREYRMNL